MGSRSWEFQVGAFLRPACGYLGFHLGSSAYKTCRFQEPYITQKHSKQETPILKRKKRGWRRTQTSSIIYFCFLTIVTLCLPKLCIFYITELYSCCLPLLTLFHSWEMLLSLSFHSSSLVRVTPTPWLAWNSKPWPKSRNLTQCTPLTCHLMSKMPAR